MEGNGSKADSEFVTAMVGKVVVVDLKSSYVCLGMLAGSDGHFLEMHDADLHDFRDGTATREVYVYDAARVGIRRNRARVLIRTNEVVAISLLADVSES